jgi:sugar/nucleoside kinase (ribokinase family)
VLSARYFVSLAQPPKDQRNGDKKVNKIEVYGIGNAIVDLQAQVDEDVITKLGLNKGSMQLVGPAEQNELLIAVSDHKLHQSSGGAAANSIIAIAQLGGQVAYGCVVGDDERGEFYLEEMRELGVAIKNQPLTGEPTGTSLVLVTPDGERTMNTHLGATSGFAEHHVNLDLLASSKWLFVEGYLFASPSGQKAIDTAIKEAKKSGVKVLLTLGDAFVPEVFGEAVQKAVESADLIIANLRETIALTKADSEEAAFTGLKKLCPKVVMTLSEKGAWVSWDGEEHRIPALKTSVIDATGAGDMFAGSFLYAITKGKTPLEAAKLGCLMASKVVSQLGARLAQ